MKTQMQKKLLSLMLTAALAAASIFSGGISKTRAETAAETSTAEQNADSVLKKSDNRNNQHYYHFADPIMSYLTKCPDGNLMRVQASSTFDGIAVEYYDTSYHPISSKLIPAELPIWGGFYAADNYYFLLTGQENLDESPDIPTYRITKYSKDWERLSCSELKDCNTTIPFKAGSARMTSIGNYLFVHTCNSMYKSSRDGKNHQANATLQLNMETGAFYKMAYPVAGYVSHSFNQFIQAENDHIVMLDQGDAYPRELVLTECSTAVTKENFVSNASDLFMATNVFAYPGDRGENITGVSVGGFEISDSSYLVAANSVIQDEKNLERDTRNIFVASVDKQTHNVTVNWLTNYSEGEVTTCTPHLVKINNNQFLLLWIREKSESEVSDSTYSNITYYTMIDGTGKQISDTYQMNAMLSDCVPIVDNNKVIWYMCQYGGRVTFYEISLNDLSQTNAVAINKNKSEYKVYFDTDEGTIPDSESLIAEEGYLDHMVTVDQRLPFLPTAFKEDFIFDGWYTSPVGGALITESTNFTEEQVVYAHYTEDEQAENPNNGQDSDTDIDTDTDIDQSTEARPDKVTQARVKSTSKGKMTVTWKTVDSADGYEIAYSVNKKFPFTKTYVKKADADDSSKTISKLSNGKAYYVKVRAYQNSDDEKIYGDWSKVKKVNIKK